MDDHLVVGASEEDALSVFVHKVGRVPSDVSLLMDDTENCVHVKSDYIRMNPSIEYHYTKCMDALSAKYCNTKELMEKMSTVLGLFSTDQLETIFQHLMDSPYDEGDALYKLCSSIKTIPEAWKDALIKHNSKFLITGSADDAPTVSHSVKMLAELIKPGPIEIYQGVESDNFIVTLKRYAYSGTALRRLVNKTAVKRETLQVLIDLFPRLSWVMEIYNLKQTLVRDGNVVIYNESRDHHREVLQ